MGDAFGRVSIACSTVFAVVCKRVVLFRGPKIILLRFSAVRSAYAIQNFDGATNSPLLFLAFQNLLEVVILLTQWIATCEPEMQGFSSLFLLAAV